MLVRGVVRWVGACAIAATTVASVALAGSAAARSPQLYEGTFTVLASPTHGPELCALTLDSLPPQCNGLPVIGWDWTKVDDEASQGGTTWGAWHVVGTYHGGQFTLTETPSAPRSRPALTETSELSPACTEPSVSDPAQGAAEWEALGAGDFGPLKIPHLVTAWASIPDAADDWFVGNVVVRPGSRSAAVQRIREHYGGPLCVVERDAPTERQLAVVQKSVSEAAARSRLGLVTASANPRSGVVIAEVWAADERARRYARQRWGHLVELKGLLRPVDADHTSGSD